MQLRNKPYKLLGGIMENLEKMIFLLGGYDLEMITLKTLFETHQITFFDKQLKWGAKLSEYNDILTLYPQTLIYGIELIEDINPPPNYHAIDHHNQHSHRPSSLFQVLDLLDIKPTRQHQLISANDIRHIQAMQCMGATTEEIETIRKKDRKIQGVTQEEEIQALQDIKIASKHHGIYTIKTKLEHFSPIVDGFTLRPLLVYSKKALNYYGDIAFLLQHYKKEIDLKNAYHGRGYFGFYSEYLNTQNIQQKVEEIITMSQHNIYSNHIFLFPFRFDKIIKGFTNKHRFYFEHDIDSRIKIDQSFKESLEKSEWKYSHFEVKSHLDYNEMVYFYDFIRDALFNSEKFEEGATSYFFEKSLSKDATFEIKIKDKEPYMLSLVGITLRLFDTGVGILSFEIENKTYAMMNDILKINDYGRRIYPQFLGKNFDIDPTKNIFLPEYVIVNGIRENFCNGNKNITLASYILDTLGESFTTNKKSEGDYYLQPLLDDRMFVVCWYGNDAFSSCVQENLMYKNWYKFVFVDSNSITVQDEEMHKDLIKKASYTRWKNYGTFFGISRYSFVCLSKNDWFGNNILRFHLQTMYYQMVVLLLAQRTSLLRFSDEITAISDIRDNKPTTENINTLYKNYLRFVNKLYFKEITSQEQGIELYDKAMEIMNTKRDMDDLRQEITALNSYAFFEQDREEKARMTKLTQLGTLFLPPTLIAGVFGMNVFPDGLIDNYYGISIGTLVIVGIFCLIKYKLKISFKEFLNFNKDGEKK